MVRKKNTKMPRENINRQKEIDRIKNDLMMKDRYMMDETKLEKLAEKAIEVKDLLSKMDNEGDFYTYRVICTECLTPSSLRTAHELCIEELEELRRQYICLSCCIKKIEGEKKKDFGHA